MPASNLREKARDTKAIHSSLGPGNRVRRTIGPSRGVVNLAASFNFIDAKQPEAAKFLSESEARTDVSCRYRSERHSVTIHSSPASPPGSGLLIPAPQGELRNVHHLVDYRWT